MFKNLNATRIGLITGIVLIILSLIFFYILKLQVIGKEQYVLYTIYTAGILTSLYLYKKSTAEDKSFKTFCSIGFKTFIVVAFLMVLYTFIFFKFNTSFRDAGIAENNALLLKEGNKTAAEIESNANQLKQIFMPAMLAITTFKYLILGTLITAIVSGFLSLKKQ